MITVVLQNAQLEINKSRSGKMLLSSEQPETRRHKDAAKYRPDILHQCLLILQDSPLNKAGRLRVLVQTTAGQVIQIHPQARIPRVYSRFTGLIIQLLERGKIFAADTKDVLLQVSRAPLAGFLETSSAKIGLSQEGGNFFAFMQNFQLTQKGKVAPTSANDCLGQAGQGAPTLAFTAESLESLTFLINVIAAGPDEFVSDLDLSLSRYALSAASCCSKICCELESRLGIF